MSDETTPIPSEDVASERERVDLTHDRVACAVHMEVFREHWPRGFGVFSVKAFEAVIGQDETWQTIKRLFGSTTNPDDGKETVSITAIEGVLDIKPACCRLEKRALVQCFRTSGVGVMSRCAICKRKALGVRYKTVVRDFNHLCFDCVAEAKPAQRP